MTIATEQENLLHYIGPENAVWSTANAGEAIPGTVTPLNWSLFGTVCEQSIRYGFQQIGVLSKRDVRVPRDNKERTLGIFYGHSAIKVDFLCEMASRVPGMSGEAMAMQMLGSAPPGLPTGRQVWRYPFIAIRLPLAGLTLKRRLDKVVRKTSLDWWRTGVRRAPMLSLIDARAQMREAYQHFFDAQMIQTVSVVAAIQPAFDTLNKLIKKTGLGDLRGDLMAGYGSHVESAMVYAMWAISRERMTLDEFLHEYGFHGPREGEISGRVWREDPAPLQRMINGYRRLGDDDDPSRLEADKVKRREAAEQKLLQALPALQRPLARLVMRAAKHFVPMRGIGKMTFLAALDVLRATARRLGELLLQEGSIDAADDVFYLTYEELIADLSPDARRVIAERKALFERYSKFTLPRWWQGQPVPISSAETHEDSGETTLRGIGASAGVIEGIVEVVTNPDFADVPDDCILVAPTTDPSWVPLMYLSKALVVDIGGELSHAAVVARELGIPCVVGTNHGSRSLKSGDYCRVDGNAGTVEILRRATI